MDRKAIFVLAVSFLLLISWPALVNRLYPPQPRTETETTETVPGETNAPVKAPSEKPSAATATPVAIADDAGAEETLMLENDRARYTFTSFGGGLKLVELKNYPAVVSGAIGSFEGKLAQLNGRAKVPLLGISAEWIGKDRGYKLEKISGTKIRAQKALNGGLLIIKEFSLGDDYLVHSSVTFSNTTGANIAVKDHEMIVGTASPAGPKDDPSMMGLFIYDGNKKHKTPAAWFDNRSFGCGPKNPREIYESGEMSVVWVAAQNQSFALAAIPKVPAHEVVSRNVELEKAESDYESINGLASHITHGYQNGLPYRGSVIDPHGSLTREFDFYAGPKELKTLSSLSARLKNNLDLNMDLDGFFGFFSKLLLFAMNSVHDFGVPYGWAIVLITVGIKLLFWPLTKASTKSMKRMQALQPQIKALQERYKDDPQKLNVKMMELWKEHKVNPLGGCLPMLVQMPVFFGFFFMIRTAIELRGADFLWIHDLATPDSVFTIPGVNFPINPMAICMAVTMVVQMRMTPTAPGMDPMQAKMMKWMPLMFVAILYNYSSGLTLYWSVQNTLSIIQTKLTQTDDKKDSPASPAAKADSASPKKQKRS